MDKISTKKLILYFFNETEMTDSVVVQHAIDYDYRTNEEYNEMKETLGHLDSMMSEPDRKTVDSILAYSRSYNKQSSVN